MPGPPRRRSPAAGRPLHGAGEMMLDQVSVSACGYTVQQHVYVIEAPAVWRRPVDRVACPDPVSPLGQAPPGELDQAGGEVDAGWFDAQAQLRAPGDNGLHQQAVSAADVEEVPAVVIPSVM